MAPQHIQIAAHVPLITHELKTPHKYHQRKVIHITRAYVLLYQSSPVQPNVPVNHGPAMAPAKKFDALRDHYRPVVNTVVRQIIMAMGQHVHRVSRWGLITDCMAAVRPAVRPRHLVVYRRDQHILFQTLRAVAPQQSLQHAVPVKKAK